MDLSFLVSTVQDGGGVMERGILSNLAPLVPIEHRLNASVYMSIVANHAHLFMTTRFPSYVVCFQQENMLSIISN